LDVPLDHQDKDSTTTEWKIRIFEDGTAKEWIKSLITCKQLAAAHPFETADKQTKVILPVLKALAKDRFTTGMNSVDEQGTRGELPKRKLTAGLNAVSVPYFGQVASAWRRQRNYMRYHLKFGETGFVAFRSQLLELNKYLEHFPVLEGRNTVEALSDNELVEILDCAKPLAYQQVLLRANYDP
jgi:hypothetical protein